MLDDYFVRFLLAALIILIVSWSYYRRRTLIKKEFTDYKNGILGHDRFSVEILVNRSRDAFVMTNTKVSFIVLYLVAVWLILIITASSTLSILSGFFWLMLIMILSYVLVFVYHYYIYQVSPFASFSGFGHAVDAGLPPKQLIVSDEKLGGILRLPFHKIEGISQVQNTTVQIMVKMHYGILSFLFTTPMVTIRFQTEQEGSKFCEVLRERLQNDASN